MTPPIERVRLRKIVAWLPMHACYIFGDFVSRLLNRLPDWDSLEWPGRALYVIYNRCMLWSVDLNDWAGFSLWTRQDGAGGKGSA